MICPIGARFWSISLNAQMKRLRSTSTLRICPPNNSKELIFALCLLQVATCYNTNLSMKTAVHLLNTSEPDKQFQKSRSHRNKELRRNLMSTLKNSYLISISGECEIPKGSKSSNFFWKLWTFTEKYFVRKCHGLTYQNHHANTKIKLQPLLYAFQILS